MNNLRFLLYTISFSVLLIMSCSEDSVEGERTGTITGTVIDDDTGLPLENVKITTNPASTTVFSDDEGNFMINSILVDNYSVQAELDSYVTDFEAVEVLESDIVNVAFELVLSETSNTPPSVPELFMPMDGAEDQLLSLEFNWDSEDAEDDDINYTLELRNGTTNEIEQYQVLNDTFLSVSNLNLSTVYFWQVRAKDDSNPEVISSISSFSTFSAEDNPILFVRRVGNNNVIFSSDESGENVLMLTEENLNSFRPKRNNDINKIAFLRTVGGETHIYTMDISGENVQQITSDVPVAGFRQENLQFTWYQNGEQFLYPSFNKLYAINNDGSGLTDPIYETMDGSFISEVEVSDFNDDLAIIKTNDIDGYNVRIIGISLSTGMEQFVVAENIPGAFSGIDIDANATKVIYSRDISESENPSYRIFNSRIFEYTIATETTIQAITEVIPGQNELFPRYSPDEGRIIFTRVLNNNGAIPELFFTDISSQDDIELLMNANMPDWE